MISQIFTIRTFSFMLSLFICLGFKIPEYYKNMPEPDEPGQVLDYYIVERNGERISLSKDKELSFVRGDILKIISAVLKRGGAQIGEVNVVGFRGKHAGEGRDDLGEEIDTSSTLDSKYWAVNPEGTLYAVISATNGRKHGIAFLKRTEPRLKYVDIRLNDKIRVMREGQVIRMKADDTFKVEKVVTNLKNLDQVRFKLVKVKKPDQKKLKKLLGNSDAYELIFQHRSYVFASIPMLVEPL